MTSTLALGSSSRLGAVMRRYDGVVHIQTLLRAGYTRRQVAWMHRSGILLRPRIGWYCDPNLPESAQRAVRLGGVLGCVSAAATYNMAVPEHVDREVHVSVQDNASRLRSSTNETEHPPAGSEAGIVLHWQPRIELVRGYRAGPADTLLQLSGCVSDNWLTAAVDSALRPGPHGAPPLLSDDAAAKLRQALPLRSLGAFGRADPTSESVPETFTRLGLIAANIPFRAQVVMETGYRLDFLLEDWLVIEIDGAEHHGSPGAFLSDRSRDAILNWFGLRVLRFSYRQVMDEWPFVLETIRRVLREGAPARHR